MPSTTTSMSLSDAKKDSLIRNMLMFVAVALFLALQGVTNQMSMLQQYTVRHDDDSTPFALLSPSKNDLSIKGKYRYQMGIDYHMKNKIRSNDTGNNSDNNANITIRGEDVRDMVVPIPRNLRIAFLGDSLSRYMYLSLVHFLHTGTWVNPEDKPNFVLEKTHPGWMSYFNFTNSRLQPHEVCDCFRPDNIGIARMVKDCRENRFYWDPVRNNSVSFLQKWGRFPIRLSWPADTLHSANHSMPDHKIPAMVEYNESQMIRNYLLQMKPAPPTILVFNAGLWGGHGYGRQGYRRDIIRALNDMNVTGIYKTTTKRRDETTMESDDYEDQFCSETPYCLNLTWTAAVPQDLYWDHLHFFEPIYKRMNFQLLELLSQIDQDDSLHIDVEEPTTSNTISSISDLETKEDNL